MRILARRSRFMRDIKTAAKKAIVATEICQNAAWCQYKKTAMANSAIAIMSYAHCAIGCLGKIICSILPPCLSTYSRKSFAHLLLMLSRPSPAINSGTPPGPGSQPVSAANAISKYPAASTPIRFILSCKATVPVYTFIAVTSGFWCIWAAKYMHLTLMTRR